jgi:hypothetical protein
VARQSKKLPMKIHDFFEPAKNNPTPPAHLLRNSNHLLITNLRLNWVCFCVTKPRQQIVHDALASAATPT